MIGFSYAWTVITVYYYVTMMEASSCGSHSCHGDVGNLAAGRDVLVSSTCGTEIDDKKLFCDYLDSECSSAVCMPCVGGKNKVLRPGSQMLDSPFTKRNTFWQSDVIRSDSERVQVQFDLETAFYFTHLIMVFRSSRPGAMIVERSVDYGKTWQVYQHYAANCSSTFGMDDDIHDATALCTSRYSSPEPCSRGEVIYRVLNPVNPISDPYSAHSRHLLKVTNLRIQMWKPQSCTKCVQGEGTSDAFRHFSVYDMIVRGTCFCNGHADSCVPLRSGERQPRDTSQAVVHGKCICEHNTDGDHCEKCLPLFNDAPWKAGNGYTGDANPCKRCNCHGHADSCHFDRGVWLDTGERTGGVCENCQHNTEGRRCDRCKLGYFRRLGAESTDPDICQECSCNVLGTVSTEIEESGNDVDITMITSPIPCDPVSGQCRCKFGVTGRRCDRCLRGYWGLSSTGCRECLCSPALCDQVSGACMPDYDDDDNYFDLRSPEDPYRYPSYSPFRFPSYDEQPKMAASWRPRATCKCKEKELYDAEAFCRMEYDYALKVRVLAAEDNGDTMISVAVKRIIKQNKVKIRKGKMFMYPESWTVMGCTCPVLFPKSEYIVVGHEDAVSNKLMINMNSFVKKWSQSKNWARIVTRTFRGKCT